MTGGDDDDDTGDDDDDDGSADDPTGADDSSGGDTSGDDGPHSGARLELRFGPGDTVLGIWDNELETECAFRTAADGRLRCLPLRGANGSAWQSATNEWVPFVSGNEECAPRFVLVDVGEGSYSCTPDGWAVHELATRVEEVCTGITDGACVITQSVGDSAPAGAGFWLAGDELDATAFVAADVANDEGGGRLVRRWLDGEDGSRVWWDLYDTERGWPCAWRDATDGTPRCLPIAPSDGTAFATNLVDTIAYRRGNDECPPEAIEWTHDGSPYGCDPTTVAVHEVGEGVDELCIQTTNGICSSTMSPADDAPAGATFWLAGVEMAVDDFVEGERSTTESPERLERRTITTADGFVTEAGTFDDELGIDCVFAVASDGHTRCLPTTFADSGDLDPATAELTVARRGNDGCPPAFLVRATAGDAFSCESAPLEVHAVAGSTDRICTTVSAGECLSWTEPSDEAPAGATFWLAGDAVDPAMFVDAQ